MAARGISQGLVAKRRQRKYLTLGSDLIPPPPTGGNIFLWLPGFPLPPFTTFQRASEASYFELENGLEANDNRFVRFAPVDLHRDNHWETWLLDTAAPVYYRSLYLEGAGASQWDFAEDFTNAIYVKSGVSVTADASEAPDEAFTMDKLVEDNALSNHQLSRDGTFGLGQILSTSIFVKKGERTLLRVLIRGRTVNGNRIFVNFDLDPSGFREFAKVTDTREVGLSTIEHISMDKRMNGSVRINISVRINGPDTEANILYRMQEVAGSDSYQGDGVSGMFLWVRSQYAHEYALRFVPSF